MTQGFCAFFVSLAPLSEAFSGRAAPLSLFSLAASSSSGLASRRTRTSRRLSGDQAKSSTSCGVSVRRSASPPRWLSSQTWVLPSPRAERKAMNLPSGLQRAREEETPSAVNGRGAPPAVGAIQMRSSFLSSLRRAVLTVYVAHFASGLSCGSRTSRIWK